MGWSTLALAKAGIFALSIAYNITALAGAADDASGTSVLSQDVKRLLNQESPLAFVNLRPALLALSADYQMLHHGRIGIAFSSAQQEAVDSIYSPVTNVCVLNTGAKESVARLYKQIGAATGWGVEKISMFIAAHEVEHCIVSANISTAIDTVASRKEIPYSVSLAVRALPGIEQ